MATWNLDRPGLALLEVAMMARDRYQEATDLLRAEGLTLEGKPHPAHILARDNLREFRQILRQLNLEIPSHG